MAAFLLVPIIAAIGFAVDTARIWLVQSRLQTAVDAAALVAGRGGAGHQHIDCHCGCDSDLLVKFRPLQ